MPAIFNPPLSSQRYKFIETFLMQRTDITSLTDVGCGNGRMLRWTKTVPHLEKMNCIDANSLLLQDEMDNHLTPNLLERVFGRKCSDLELFINVFNGDIAIPDDRLNADCFTLVEMIEHVDFAKLDACIRTIFGYYQPRYVVVTTPNTEFNPLLNQISSQDGNQLGDFMDKNKPKDPNNPFRHWDHKFEFTQAEFKQWTQTICAKYNYEFELDGVGHLPGISESYGPCTQIAIFRRKSAQPISLEQSESCFDLLMNKLTMVEPHCTAAREKQEITLMGAFSIPGNRHFNDAPTPATVIDWSEKIPQDGTPVMSQEEYEYYHPEEYDLGDYEMDDEEQTCDDQDQQQLPQYDCNANNTDLIGWG